MSRHISLFHPYVGEGLASDTKEKGLETGRQREGNGDHRMKNQSSQDVLEELGSMVNPWRFYIEKEL